MTTTAAPIENQDLRSGFDLINPMHDMMIEGDLKASLHNARKGQQQYQTPEVFAQAMAMLLPPRLCATVLDPHCASGRLLSPFKQYGNAVLFGSDIDTRAIDSNQSEKLKLMYCHCVKFHKILKDTFPDKKPVCIVANPPFGLKFKHGDTVMDSTEWTWMFIKDMLRPRGAGYMIANADTIERLRIHEDPWVYCYSTFAPETIFEGADVRIGVVHYVNRQFALMNREVIHWDITKETSIFNKPHANYHSAIANSYECRIAAQKVKAILDAAYGQWSNEPQQVYKTYDVFDINLLRNVVKEENTANTPKFNVYLNEEGMIRTYLKALDSVRISKQEAVKLARLEGCHPYTLVTEKSTRDLLNEFINRKIFTISPAAKEAIEDALKQSVIHSAPIMPPTDFGLVAYADEEDALVAKIDSAAGQSPRSAPHFVKGKSYKLSTLTYQFKEYFDRNKVHFSKETGETYSMLHKMSITGQDRVIVIRDENGFAWRFMERPQPTSKNELPESMLWDIFEKPTVRTVADINKSVVEENLERMAIHEMLSGFEYFPGQKQYYSVMGVKDYGLIAAETGTGKTLGALSLMTMKSPKRTLICAPQGTMVNPDSGDEDDYDNAAQWVKEIRRFAPGEPVFELFNQEDYKNILKRNNDTLPYGIYITYPQALFQNNAMENIPDSWKHEKLCKELGIKTGPYKVKMKLKAVRSDDPPFPVELPSSFDKYEEGAFMTEEVMGRPVATYKILEKKREYQEDYTQKIGEAVGGIRCLCKPSLITQIETDWALMNKFQFETKADSYPFEMVIFDEAHLFCNLASNRTQSFIRIQPRYRFALTATPIPNIITNIFSLMGWLCVEDWYKGERRNVAWPYSVDESYRFSSTFLCYEFDHTEEMIRQKKDAKYKGKPKPCPSISSPARLIKLLSPTMAFISKKQCNEALHPCEVIDVRVPLGTNQLKLYAYFMERGNITHTKNGKPLNNDMVRAMLQSSYLRDVCAAPADLEYCNTKKLRPRSNFNPKTMAVMQIIIDCLTAGEQVVVITARVNQTNEIARRLKDAGVTYSRIDSSVPPNQHASEANAFKAKESSVMLMGIKCAQAYSFEQCTNAIIASLEWSYGSLEQAKGRVWRLTSPKKVKVWVVLHKDSIEEALYDRVATKQDAATICLHGKRIPRDFKMVEADEIFADHYDNFDMESINTKDESDCENFWPTMREQLALVNHVSNLK